MKNLTLRRIGQWSLLLFLVFFWIKAIFFKDTLFDFEACCPFGGIQAMTTFFVNDALACTMDGMQVFMGGILILSTILAAKLFCGHVCPIGTVSEGFSRLGKRFKLRKFEIGGTADLLLRSLKYILLFIVFYFTLKTNDLFCKQFDPYYSSASLFGEDVTVWMGILSIAILIGGAIFFRHFWCRYLCPLGAISGAFKFLYVFIVFAIVLVVLNQAEVEINLTLVLAAMAILAYALEIVSLNKRAGYQVLHITRNEDTCIDCGLCDKACPQGIKVSQMKKVNHPDCNLCTECMGQCPHEESIGINNSTKFRWLPTLIVVALIMAGFIFGTNTSIPTVDMNWGPEEAEIKTANFEMTGLKNVKCYGSSMAFVDRMKRVPGVTGVATYIRDHMVSIDYDSTKITADQIKQAIFVPKFMDIHTPKNEAEVRMVDFYIENFFDELDVIFIANLSAKIDGVYSFKTFYGDPVRVRFYVDENFKADSLKNIIENSDLIYRTPEESFSSEGLYTVSNMAESDTLLSGLYLKSMSFPSFKQAFNNRSKYSNDQLASVAFPIKSYPKNQQFMPYVVNHLGKADENVVGLISRYTKDGPVAVVFYVKGKTTPANIARLLDVENLMVHYDNGTVEEVFNPYKFEIPPELNKNN